MDGGSADIAGANICPYVLYICVALISYIHVTMRYPAAVHPTHIDVGSAEYVRINLPPWIYAL
jgi:hypothetical protein